ncbi:ester cyclase [Kocuria sabuli]|uniref:ester cyclase n=1 Tax=Kocuria sabuli TaxID=3071448 RepID=UPI0034D5B5E7
MSASGTTDHRDVIEQWTKSFNAHDAVGVAALYAEDARVVHPSYREPLQGRKPVQDDTRAYMIAMPDASSELIRVVADGDCAAAEVAIAGVHAGPLVLATRTFPPTGRRLRFPMVLFCRFGPGGQVVEERRYFDTAGILRQLGNTEH